QTVAPLEEPPMPGPDLAALITELVTRHGLAKRPRIARGIAQVAALWQADDGDLASFVREHFIADDAALDSTFARLEAVFEQIDGHTHEVGREVRRATEVDIGPMLAIDPLLASYEPFAHLGED